MNGVQYDHLAKILLLGNSSVGKSCLLLRYTENRFNEAFYSTIGVDFKVRTIVMRNKSIKMQIWDTAGQEKFRSITSQYYRGAHGIMMIFDLTNKDSFNDLDAWIQEIERYGGEKLAKVLIGNKCDLEEKRAISFEEAKAYADKLGISYYETSAKDAANIDAGFVKLAELIIAMENRIDKKRSIVENPKKSSCCV